MKITGTHKSGPGNNPELITHRVELTEKDLLLLEQMCIYFEAENEAEYIHKDDLHTQVKEMLQDY